MSATLDSTWGPYRSQSDALFSLGRFANRACGPGIGLAWSSGGMLYPLRRPVYDSDGFGDVLVVEWNPPALPAKPHVAASAGFWDRMMRVIERGLELQGQAEIAQAQAMNAFANSVLTSRFAQHSDDGVAVALDAIGVVVSLTLLASTGVGLLGLLALGGSAFLLGVDGAIYGTEMSGDEDGAKDLKESTEAMRITATILTLPDLFWNGAKALIEFREAQELLRMDQTTSQAAQKLSTRAALKTRAAKYADIAEKANLRARLRTQQIQASMRLEIMPRVAGVAGIGLLVREEITTDASLLNQTRQWLRMHVVAVNQ